MSILDTIARPYAQAIFDIAIQDDSIQQWKKILIFLNEIASHKNIRKFLSGAVSPQYLSSCFIRISFDMIDEKAKNLIKLLSENQRFKILHNILQQFLILESNYKNIIIVELTSAFPLKETQIIQIREILEKSFLKKVQFHHKIDSKILNGIIIKINNTVFDFSVHNYLKQLSNSLNF